MKTTTTTPHPEMEQLKDTIDRISSRRSLGGVERIREYTVDYTAAMQAVEALGRRLTPRFTIDRENRWAYTQLLKWLYADPTMRSVDPVAASAGRPEITAGRLTAGVYLFGPTGTGKSVAMELLNVIADVDSPRVRLGEKVQAIHFGCYRAEEIWERATAKDASLSVFKTMPILCIQDLGSEPAEEAVSMGSRREPIRQIIEARGDRSDLMTLITSNYGMCDPKIQERYGERVVSRLREMCNLIVLNGHDRRAI